MVVWAVFSGIRLAVSLSKSVDYKNEQQKTLLTVSGGQGWENRWTWSLVCDVLYPTGAGTKRFLALTRTIPEHGAEQHTGITRPQGGYRIGMLNEAR